MRIQCVLCRKYYSGQINSKNSLCPKCSGIVSSGNRHGDLIIFNYNLKIGVFNLKKSTFSIVSERYNPRNVKKYLDLVRKYAKCINVGD